MRWTRHKGDYISGPFVIYESASWVLLMDGHTIGVYRTLREAKTHAARLGFGAARPLAPPPRECEPQETQCRVPPA